MNISTQLRHSRVKYQYFFVKRRPRFRRRRRRREPRLEKIEFIFYKRNSRMSRSARYGNGSKKVLS